MISPHMSTAETAKGAQTNGNGDSASQGPPSLRDNAGKVNLDSVPDVIQWFLDFDQRVAIVKHPNVEEVFHWKQRHSQAAGEQVFAFNHAEDRLAIGVIRALAEHSTESELHSWISQLLNALDSASKSNEATTAAYQLDLQAGGSVVTEAAKIPSARGRDEFLINCWIETLCTAEARVLGWLYQELYRHPYVPDSTFAK